MESLSLQGTARSVVAYVATTRSGPSRSLRLPYGSCGSSTAGRDQLPYMVVSCHVTARRAGSRRLQSWQRQAEVPLTAQQGPLRQQPSCCWPLHCKQTRPGPLWTRSAHHTNRLRLRRWKVGTACAHGRAAQAASVSSKQATRSPRTTLPTLKKGVRYTQAIQQECSAGSGSDADRTTSVCARTTTRHDRAARWIVDSSRSTSASTRTGDGGRVVSPARRWG